MTLYALPAFPAREALVARGGGGTGPGPSPPSKKKHPRGPLCCPASLEPGNVSLTSRSQVWGGPGTNLGSRGTAGKALALEGHGGALEALTVPSRERQRPRCRQRPQSTFLNLETQAHLNQQGKGPRSCPETPGSDRRVWLQNDLNHDLFCSQCGS